MRKINKLFGGMTLLFFLISMAGFGQNETCATAIAVDCGVPIVGSTVGVSGSDTETGGCTMSAYGEWYTFTGDGNMYVYDLSVGNTGYDLEMSISSGSCGSLSNIVCRDSAVSGDETYELATVDGTVYYIYIAHYSSSSTATGDYTINANCVAPPEPVENETCATAESIACGQTIVGTTDGTSGLDSETGGCNQSDYGVWYTFTGDGNSYTYELVAENVSLDLEMSVSSGSCGSLTNLACRDSAASGDETFTLDSVDGTTYYVYISYWSTFGTTTGDFTLTATCVAGPTCTDGIQNGDEEGVDCGGSSCATCPPMLCDSVPSSNDGVGIDALTVGSETFTSGGDLTYEDFTGTQVTLEATLNANTQIDFGHGLTYLASIWIDFNDDLEFDPTEQVFDGESAGGTPNILDASFIMPAGNLGNHIMRISTTDFATPDPCYNGSWGVTMDVDVKIVSPPCIPAVINSSDIAADCTPGSESFMVNVDVASPGFMYQITDGTTTWPAFAPGLVQVGPFANGASVELTVNHFDPTCDFSLGTFTNTCPPANDTCEGTVAVACGSSTMGSTVAATNDSDPACGSNFSIGSHGVWYELDGTGQVFTITTCSANTNFDTKLNVYTGADCTTLSCVAGDDDASCSHSSLHSTVEFTSVAGETYYILVTSFSSSSSGEGDFELTIECNDPPENDLCENALPIDCGSGEVSGSNAYGSDIGEGPFCGTTPGDKGVWYVFEGNDTDVTLSTCNANTDYDTKINVYSGDCGALVCVDGDDDASCSHSNLHSEVTFFASTGETYYIYVSGFGDASGNFVLSTHCALQAEIDSDCNTVYAGYGPDSCADLGVTATFGVGNYTYSWSDATGEIGTGSTINVCPTEDTVYTVEVTSGDETITLETTVLAVDVTCKNDKVLVCHNGNTICISPNAVQSHLDHGDSLGDCDTNITVTCDSLALCATDISPADGSIDVNINSGLSWSAAGNGYTAGYIVSVGTTSGGTDIVDNVDVGSATSYALSLDFSTTYYVSVIAYNHNGLSEGCAETSFTVQDYVPPCENALVLNCGDSINDSTNGVAENDSPQGCGLSNFGKWYTIVGTGAQMTIDVTPIGSYDTELSLSSGSCDSLNNIDCVDDGFSGSDPETITFASIAGVNYYLYVAHWLTGSSTTGDFNISLTCPPPPEPNVVCGVTENYTYCYDDNDTSAFNYSTGGGAQVTVVFNAGQVENTWDELIILDSDGSEMYNGYGTFGDLAGLSFTSSGDNITVQINADFSNSCGSLGYTTWDYDVSCSEARMVTPEVDTIEDTDTKLEWSIYPNPTKSDQVTLGLLDYIDQDVTIEIIDFTGKVLVKQSINEVDTARQTISLNSLINGVYIVRLSTDESVSTKRLIVSY